MQTGEQIALTHFWFAWNDATTRKALLAVVLERFSETAERVFRDNVARGLCPNDWDGFEALRRNPRNIRRVVEGENGTTMEFLVGAAALLGVDVRDFFPDTVEWVAQATLQLVAWNRPGPQAGQNGTHAAAKRPTYGDARAYAEFLLAHPPCPKTVVDVKALTVRLQQLDPPHAHSIRTVTASLSAVLTERDAVVKQREERHARVR